MMTFRQMCTSGHQSRTSSTMSRSPLKFPRWNSAVQVVRSTSPVQREVVELRDGARAPGGRVENRLEIVARDSSARVRRAHDLGADAPALPLPLRRRRRRTDLALDAEVELAGIASLTGPLGEERRQAGG